MTNKINALYIDKPRCCYEIHVRVAENDFAGNDVENVNDDGDDYDADEDDDDDRC